MHYVELPQHKAFRDDGPNRVALTRSAGLTVELACLKSGQAIRDERVGVEVCLHVLEGQGTLQVEMTYHRAGPGAFFHLEPETTHSITARSDLVVLITQAPNPRA